ncbi:Bug family tripartite tricarboxylate transporter substrate binding protein [Halocatena marina]|uniref:Bug family tripartite tricarboxylate transporter substrate binding protein n=1 Tax=Halocatena marina TaxID=2934937 RepID=A0ABD5YXQ1_9EURY|nr:tripartite tricarboxylate transporter substrate-binding protein [Halocatena marina]
MSSEETSNINRRKFIKAAGAVSIVGLAGCTSGDGNETTEGGGASGWEPSRNVRVIIPWAAGGGTDTMTRGVLNPAEKMLSERGINVTFTFENVTGAGGLNAARRVLNQPADGHTLFPSTNAISPNIATGQADFTLDDWGYICRVQHDTSWIYTSGRDAAEHDSIDSLVKKAKNGNEVQIGAVGGITGAAFSILWADTAGILNNTSITTYQDAGRMRTDTISGEIDAAFGEIQELKEQHKAGDINLILVGVKDKLKKFSDVPTTSENGWDVTYGVSRGFNVKSGTPDAAIQFWDDVIQKAMQTDSYQQLEQETLLYLREGYQGSDEWRATMEDEVNTYEQVVKPLNSDM